MDKELDISDPRSEWYSPANQSTVHERGMLNAAIEGRNDDITQFDRYRTWPKTPKIPLNEFAREMGVQPVPSISYTTKVPPWLAGSVHQQFVGNPDVNILPLNSLRDPNYAYGLYAHYDQHATNLNNTWKTLANMPESPFDVSDTPDSIIGRKNEALESLSERFQIASRKAGENKQRALELQDAYNRQIGIQNLRQWEPDAHEDALAVEQASRDFSLIDSGLASGRLKDTSANEALRNKAMLNLENKMHTWDSKLESRGFMGAKGPYLLSGVPGQFLDDLADKGARDLRLTNENIKMFQSRYMKDAPFRASVNQGLKAKVPGVLAAGIGGALVKQKMDEGESLPKAIGATAGEIVLGAAKFAVWDRFVGPGGDLNQGENEYLYNRDRVKFVQQLDDTQMAEIEKDFPGIRKEEARVAKVLREKMKESKEVEENITNSPLWNKTK